MYPIDMGSLTLWWHQLPREKPGYPKQMVQVIYIYKLRDLELRRTANN